MSESWAVPEAVKDEIDDARRQLTELETLRTFAQEKLHAILRTAHTLLNVPEGANYNFETGAFVPTDAD